MTNHPSDNLHHIIEPVIMPYQDKPFNGDAFIQEEFLRLRDKFGIKNVVETGTFFGYTSKWMSENFRRVFTIEINHEFAKIAERRFLNIENITFNLGDSAVILSDILTLCGNDTMIFLDAHWNDFCPLKSELEAIGKSGLKPIIAIHDFMVPNASLGYDTYKEQAFTFEWLKEYFDRIYGHDCYDYYYNTEEKSGGAKRGIIYMHPIRTIAPSDKNEDDWIFKLPTLPSFKKYSQCGEEGILEFILNSIGHGNRFLVDIGAWDGTFLSNTKYFIESHGYRSLLMDGNNHGSEEVKQEWITKDNICDLLAKYDCPESFSLLSFDLDGNDYDIISSILEKYRPRMIVCEINTDIPLHESKKIKYNPDHRWGNDDYFGFSFSAALQLAKNNGYRVVHQHMWNVYMVHEDFLSDPKLEIKIEFKPLHCHPHNSTGEWESV